MQMKRHGHGKSYGSRQNVLRDMEDICHEYAIIFHANLVSCLATSSSQCRFQYVLSRQLNRWYIYPFCRFSFFYLSRYQ